jgi:hypothetical protein
MPERPVAIIIEMMERKIAGFKAPLHISRLEFLISI